MIDLDRILRMAAKHAAGERVALAAPYDLSDWQCRELAAEGVFAGYVANSAPRPGDRNPFIAGWWIDRRAGLCHFRYATTATLVLLGAHAQDAVAAALLAEARRKGIRRILVVDGAGSVLAELDPGRGPAVPAAAPSSGPVGDLCYEAAYDKLFAAVGHQLRLPAASFERKRVMLLIGSLGPGGAERQAAYTAAGLARRQAYEMIVGCKFIEPPPADFFRPVVEAAGGRVVPVPSRPAEYDWPGLLAARRHLAGYDALGIEGIYYTVLQFAALIREVRPAIVHTWMDYCNVLAGIAADLVGVPSLVMCGRSGAPDNFPAIFQPYMRPGYWALLGRRRAMLLNNSHAGAADYARWLDLPEDAIRVIHNGFHLPAELAPSARDEVRAELGVPADAFVVGSITRFSEEKRPQLFIDMARVLAASHPRLRFVVFGNGVKLEEMRAYVASAGLGGVVRLPGLTDNAWRSLAAMDVFVLTSRFEGLPNVLVEAQASGLPIVCTGVGGMVETFVEGETGYSVPAATPEALADAVARLADDPALRARMSDRAFRHARAAFGIETMLDQTARAYDDQYARDALRLRQELATVHPPALHGGALAAGEGRHPGIRGP